MNEQKLYSFELLLFFIGMALMLVKFENDKKFHNLMDIHYAK